MKLCAAEHKTPMIELQLELNERQLFLELDVGHKTMIPLNHQADNPGSASHVVFPVRCSILTVVHSPGD